MQDTVEIICPYCGELNEIFLDYSGGDYQQYVEDCQVCCRAWDVRVDISEEEPVVLVATLDD